MSKKIKLKHKKYKKIKKKIKKTPHKKKVFSIRGPLRSPWRSHATAKPGQSSSEASGKFKKKRKGKGSPPQVSKKVVTDDKIMDLISKGRQRGFVTESEILHSFPQIEKDIDGLEKLYERLESANVNI